MTIRDSNLLRFNATQLVVLKSLLNTRSVSLTADELNISQPAASRALAQLRDAFDDELFYRTKNGLYPTAKAEALEQQVRDHVESLSRILGSGSFDPYLDERNFKIAVNDAFVYTLLPKLMRNISLNTPNVTLESASLDEELFQNLATGQVDFAFGEKEIAEADSRLEFIPIMKSNYAGVCRDRHPLVMRPITPERFLEQRHGQFSSRAQKTEVMGDVFLEASKTRKIAFRGFRLPVMLEAIAEGDIIITCTEVLADQLASDDRLVKFKLPFEMNTITLGIIYHNRSASDPSMQWLISEIRALSEKFIDQKYLAN